MCYRFSIRCRLVYSNQTCGCVAIAVRKKLALQNGCILCELMNNAQKKHSYNQKEIYKYIGYTLQQDLGDQLFYVRLNVETFVRWCKNFGCDTSLLCEVGDLVERKDLERSLSCIHAVARRLAELKLSYPKSVRLEVKYHMSYNQIIELFNEENSNLTPYQIGIKESFSEFCEIIGLGKIDSVGRVSSTTLWRSLIQFPVEPIIFRFSSLSNSDLAQISLFRNGRQFLYSENYVQTRTWVRRSSDVLQTYSRRNGLGRNLLDLILRVMRVVKFRFSDSLTPIIHFCEKTRRATLTLRDPSCVTVVSCLEDVLPLHSMVGVTVYKVQMRHGVFLNQLFKTNPTQPEFSFYLIGKKANSADSDTSVPHLDLIYRYPLGRTLLVNYTIC
eukprot:sb/3465590/